MTMSVTSHNSRSWGFVKSRYLCNFRSISIVTGDVLVDDRFDRRIPVIASWRPGESPTA